MNRQIKIIDEQRRDNAVQALADIPFHPLHVVIIKPFKMDRSVAQNSLMWVMLTHLEKHSETGYTKDEFHEMFKEKYLYRIYVKNPDRHQTLVSNIQAIAAIIDKGCENEAKILWENTLKNLSTTEADVDEFKEYLECIEHEMRELNCPLPVKDDVYRRAMG